ncbi:hypothetical protein [Carboxylicivirga marina]|uniref:hypothetical protein n=1 Tax=Carboxylicivirga marina TaxID=2800988 RepID=UPI002599955D|nr:hypothetical protein [uncultured Carboxylicivirga sp.]
MTKSTLILIVALLSLTLKLHGQSLGYSGPVSSSLAYVKVFDDSHWASLNNVANQAHVKSLSVGAAYQMRFNLSELSSRAATAIVPSRFGSFSGLAMQSGFSKSNYNRYAVAYSRLFGNSISAGFQFNYMNHQMQSADRADAFYSAFGLGFKTTESIKVGVYIQNPEQSKLSYQDEAYALPTFFNGAIKYSIPHKFFAIFELEKELEYDVVYKTAIQFSFNDKLFVRGGVRGKPVEITFGGGFQLVGLSIDVGFSHHQQLGMTSGAGLAYSFKHKQ